MSDEETRVSMSDAVLTRYESALIQVGQLQAALSQAKQREEYLLEQLKSVTASAMKAEEDEEQEGWDANGSPVA